MNTPTLQDIYAARTRVYRALKPSPLLRHPLLAQETGLDVRVKHENHNPTGAFKVRGGLNLIGSLAHDRGEGAPGVSGARRGVITATTGNHGQSIALACAREGVPCTIVVPFGNNPEKNAAMRAYGAELIEFGKDFDEAREKVEQLQHERGLRYVHSANEPLLMLNSRAKIIGVQAANADAFARSWRGPSRVVGGTAATFAEGMATRVTFDLTFEILKRELDDIVTLTEDELADGVRLALRTTHNLAEGAGAASLAAAMKLRASLAGKKIVCVMSGGNIDRTTLTRILTS